MDAVQSLRVTLVHDWLTGMRGGEKVLEVMCRRWPQAPLYTLLHRRGSVSAAIEDRPIVASYLNRWPGIDRYYRYTLPLMPGAISWRLPECDLVMSSSHCVAKGIIPPPNTPHICYCHTPMRYAWHLREAYFARRGVKAWVIGKLLDRLRAWDRDTAAHVTHFVANSEVVRQRIRDCYDRDAVVIPPPVDTTFYCPHDVTRENYYLILSAFAPYKRLDLAITACKKLKRRLVVLGSGQDDAKLRDLADHHIEFLGWQPDEVLRDHLRTCRALLFPGEEDFGIVPVEAQACGTPVIAFGRGGATETVLPLGQHAEPTGVWFDEQTPECLADAILQFEAHADAFSPIRLRQHALQFRTERFESELFAFVADVTQTTPARRQAA